MGVTRLPIVAPKTWATLLAGSVLTSRTRLSCRAKWTAVAHAMLVLPTPPLPVKKKCRGASARNFIITISRGHRRDQQQPDSVEGALVESQHPPTAGTGSMVCEPQQDEGVAVSEEQHSVREVSVRPA